MEHQFITRRNRPSLVCNLCKKRKIKCDKGRPCSSCVRNKCSDACNYESNWSHKFPSVTDTGSMPSFVRSARVPVAIISSPHGSHKSTTASNGNIADYNNVNDHHIDKKFRVHKFAHPTVSHPTVSHPTVSHPTVSHPAVKIEPTDSFAAKSPSPTPNDKILISQSHYEELKSKLKHLQNQEKRNLAKSTPTTSTNKPTDTGGFNFFMYKNSLRYEYSDEPTPIVVNKHTKHVAYNNSGVLVQVQDNVHDPKFPGSVPCQNKNITSYPRISVGGSHEEPMSDFKTGFYVGVNPFQDRNETINFYETLKPAQYATDNAIAAGSFPQDSTRATSSNVLPIPPSSLDNSLFGPFSWLSISRRDPWLAVLRHFTQKQKIKNQMRAHNLAKSHKHCKLSRSGSDPCDESAHVKSLLAHINAASGNGISGSRDNRGSDTTSSNGFGAKGPASNDEGDGSLGISPSRSHSLCTSADTRDSTPCPYETFARKALSDNLKDDIPFQPDYEKTKISNLNRNALTLRLTIFDAEVDSDLKLIEQIQSVLPKRKVIWLMLKRFFSFLYPFFPLIDEFDLRENLERILGPESYEDEKLSPIRVEKRIDLAHIGILFVLMRLSYLSLFSNNPDLNFMKLNATENSSLAAQEVRYLLLNPIHLHAIDVAHVCLNQFQIMRNVSLPVLQCAIFLKIYSQCAPEDGDGIDSNEPQVFHGILVQMAYSLGLNREPEKVKFGQNQDKRKNHLIRKIWIYLCTEDYRSGCTHGSFLTIDPRYYDTKIPFVEPGNSNIRDEHLENATTKTFAYHEAFIKGPMKDIMGLLQAVDADVKISDFTKHLNHVEYGSHSAFGRLIDYLQPLECIDSSYSSAKILKSKICMDCKCSFLVLHLHLFSYYEDKGNKDLMFFYMQKMFSIVMEELIPCFLPFIFKAEQCFGEGANVLLNPHIERAIYRAHEVLIIAIVRASHYIHNCEKSPDHVSKLKYDSKYRGTFERLIKMVNVLLKASKICLFAAYALSSRYYIAWTISKAHNFMISVITNEEFYSHSKCYKDPAFCTDSQLDRLTSMGTNALVYLEKIMEKNCRFINLKDLYQKSDEELRARRGNTESYIDKVQQRLAEIDAQRKFEEANKSQSGNVQRTFGIHEQYSNHFPKSPIPALLNPFRQPNKSLSSADINSASDTPSDTSTSSEIFESMLNLYDFANIPDLISDNQDFGPKDGLPSTSDAPENLQMGNAYIPYQNAPDIDSLWLQMIASKNSKHQSGLNIQNVNANESNTGMGDQVDASLYQRPKSSYSSNHQQPLATNLPPGTVKPYESNVSLGSSLDEYPNADHDQLQQNLSNKYLDLFSDLPLDQVFFQFDNNQ